MKKLYLISPDKKRKIPDFINLKNLHSCLSTNDYINNNLFELSKNIPLLVSADTQSEGKGRNGHKWTSVGDGGIYISFLLNIKNREYPGLISLAVAAAAAEAIRNVVGLDVQLKWPNDIELAGLKVGGILIENKLYSDKMLAIIGIGLNVNVEKNQFENGIAKTATSLSVASGRKIDIEQLELKISEYLLYFISAMEEKRFGGILKKYLYYLKHKVGEEIVFTLTGKKVKGSFVRINEDGGLVLMLENGKEVSVYSGEIY